jgi:splicing factor 3B subunit 1
METPKRGEATRWDETPVTQRSGATPFGGAGLETPTPGSMTPMTPEGVFAQRWQQEIDWKNRELADDELDLMFPEGYEVVEMPNTYRPIRTPGRKLTATPTPYSQNFIMNTPSSNVES